MLTTLRATLDAELGPEARDWLDQALQRTASLGARFAAARRACGTTHAADVRFLLLCSHQPTVGPLTELYEHGTAAERREILRALPHLRGLSPETAALPLVHDALRTNDPRLITAALGPYGASHLAAHDWRQAVLKCLFTGIPLAELHGLAERSAGDAELARMLRDFAAERTAAGRPVPDDLQHALELTARPHSQES